MDNDALRYYTTHNRITDPAQHADLLDSLPEALPDLHAALNGLLIHNWKVRADHPHLLAAGIHHTFIRHIRALLDAVVGRDDRPLNVVRPVERRVIVDCRHFATLLCATLRHRGIPARARCGFAGYLEPTHWQDHWICELWNEREGRWTMEDADLQRHDVPPDEFITGVRAWQMYRAEPSSADRFGYDADTRGELVVRGNLVRDFAALNGFESVSGDTWGLALPEGDLPAGALLLLDRAAELGADDHRFAARRDLYDHGDGPRVPAVIRHFDYLVANAWRDVDWQHEP